MKPSIGLASTDEELPGGFQGTGVFEIVQETLMTVVWDQGIKCVKNQDFGEQTAECSYFAYGEQGNKLKNNRVTRELKPPGRA